MAIQPEIHLGPYEIVSDIGAGGMGEIRSSGAMSPSRFCQKPSPVTLSVWLAFNGKPRFSPSLDHPNIAHLRARQSMFVSVLLDGRVVPPSVEI
jgi:hypothetical protein